MNLSVEHVLMFALVVCALYYLMGKCGCRRFEGMTGQDWCQMTEGTGTDYDSKGNPTCVDVSILNLNPEGTGAHWYQYTQWLNDGVNPMPGITWTVDTGGIRSKVVETKDGPEKLKVLETLRVKTGLTAIRVWKDSCWRLSDWHTYKYRIGTYFGQGRWSSLRMQFLWGGENGKGGSDTLRAYDRSGHAIDASKPFSYKNAEDESRKHMHEVCYDGDEGEGPQLRAIKWAR